MPEQPGNHNDTLTSNLANPLGQARPELPKPATPDIAKHAKDVAGSAMQQAKDIVTTQVTEKTGKGATDLGNVAKALHQTSKELEGNLASPYVEKAADELDRISQFLRTKDVGDIVKTVEVYARREPLMFLGGAFALGVIGARFLKASGHRGGTGGGVREGAPRGDGK